MRLTEDLKDLATVRPFLVLLTVRLFSQSGDGLVQAGLASLFFFRPQNMTSASGVATALVVLLLPYCAVGPFAGTFIDRWRRRQSVLVCNLLRVALVLVIVAVLHTGGVGPAVYLLTLVVLGVNRFLLAVLSAAVPYLVDSRRLLVANTIMPPMGGVAHAVGLVIGVLLRLLLPAGPAQDTAALFAGAGLYAGAALVVVRMIARNQLGPARVDRESAPLAVVAGAAGDLVDTVRYLVRRGTPALVLATMATHRFVYGMELITAILVARNLLTSPDDADAGLAIFATLVGAMTIGHGVSVILTALAHEWVTPPTWLVVCFVGGSVGQLVMFASSGRTAMTAGMFVFGVGVQGAKTAVDTIVQTDTADAYRGRVFSVYDLLFNVAECVAAGVAVLVMPDTGWSRGVQAVLVVLVWAAGAGYWFGMRRLGGRPREVGEAGGVAPAIG